MRKQLVIIGIIVAIILIVVVTSSLSLLQQGKRVTSIPTPIPIPVPVSPGQEINILNISPPNGSTNVNKNTEIQITFDRDISSSDIDFAILPGASFNIIKNGNTAVAHFTQPLKEDTTYFYNFLYKGVQLHTFTLATGGSIQEVPGDTNINIGERAAEEQLANDPSLYLSNYSPYETADFAMKVGYENAKAYFDIILKNNKEQGKQAFISWLKSIDLTDEKIQHLDLRYQ